MTRKIAVGRIVRYFDPDVNEACGDEEILAALIVKVVDEKEGLVNLKIFHADGGTGFHKGAKFALAAFKIKGSWHWPPRPYPFKKKKPKPA